MMKNKIYFLIIKSGKKKSNEYYEKKAGGGEYKNLGQSSHRSVFFTTK